jgi:hypothetical protein
METKRKNEKYGASRTALIFYIGLGVIVLFLVLGFVWLKYSHKAMKDSTSKLQQ